MKVNDELIIDCPNDEKEIAMQILKNEMENAVKLDVPLSIDLTESYRWSDGH